MNDKTGQERPRLIGRRALLGSLGVLWLVGCSRAAPAYSLIMDRPGDQAQVTATGAGDQTGVTVRIESQSGIGRLDFAWWTAAPPRVTAIVLALAGLEHVALHWGDRTISTAWHDSTSAWATRTVDGQAPTSLSPDDRDWLSVTQLPDGGFLLTPPASFNAAAPLTWQVAWIDFYR